MGLPRPSHRHLSNSVKPVSMIGMIEEVQVVIEVRMVSFVSFSSLLLRGYLVRLVVASDEAKILNVESGSLIELGWTSMRSNKDKLKLRLG
jgi:hypothetical protein